MELAVLCNWLPLTASVLVALTVPAATPTIVWSPLFRPLLVNLTGLPEEVMVKPSRSSLALVPAVPALILVTSISSTVPKVNSLPFCANAMFLPACSLTVSLLFTLLVAVPVAVPPATEPPSTLKPLFPTAVLMAVATLPAVTALFASAAAGAFTWPVAGLLAKGTAAPLPPVALILTVVTPAPSVDTSVVVFVPSINLSVLPGFTVCVVPVAAAT